MKESKLERCLWKEVIETERKHNASVRGYLRSGCLNCSGYLSTCNNYIPHRNDKQLRSYLQEEE